MKNLKIFKKTLQEKYQSQGKSVQLGAAMLKTDVFPDVPILMPLKSFNRHGLIAGATGTGKTKTAQVIAEQLSAQGVPVLLMDLKGDLSGLAEKGEPNSAIKEREKKIGVEYHPMGFPVEFLTLSNEPGLKLRATISEFGPLLFSKILDLNSAQTSIVSMLFQFCDDNKLLLLDLKDFKKILNYALNEGKEAITKKYGYLSSSSINAILRKMIELEQQGGNNFFGEPAFKVEDLLRTDERHYGYLSILRLIDLQSRPKLFSTFMLCLLAQIYAKFPEEGDTTQPKLVIYIDEAHLLFENASKELLSQIESIVKLIRSKGVGVFFSTQYPTDIPEAVLGQLGMKVQHALRAFSAKDRKTIRLIAKNYPESEFYDTESLLTSLGIGEALVTVLDDKGHPTPLAKTLLCAPSSRMGPLSENEIDAIVQRSRLADHYNQVVDRISAYEILNDKMQQAKEEGEPSEVKSRAKKSKEKSWAKTLSQNTMVRQMGRTLVREITRGLLGALGSQKGRRR